MKNRKIPHPFFVFAHRLMRPIQLRLPFVFCLGAMAGMLTAGEPAPIVSNAGDAPARTERSVHLFWSAPSCEAFCNEVVVGKSTAGSYFMTCGWSDGYLGVQELASGKKIALFSVWDSVAAGNNPDAVKGQDRVEVLFSEDGTRIKRFGGKGTGQQCQIDWPWEIGQTNRFLVRAFTEGGKTAYAGFIYDPRKQQWRHLATFRRSTSKGGGLNGLYSFIDDFRRDFKSATEVRRRVFKMAGLKRNPPAGSRWAKRDSPPQTPPRRREIRSTRVSAGQGGFSPPAVTRNSRRNFKQPSSGTLCLVPRPKTCRTSNRASAWSHAGALKISSALKIRSCQPPARPV